MSAPALVTRCRFCRCTEAQPCVLPHGDTCLLSVETGLCTNPRCVIAAQKDARRIAAGRRDELAALVRPIAERWRQSWAEDRARRRRLKSKTKRRVA